MDWRQQMRASSQWQESADKRSWEDRVWRAFSGWWTIAKGAGFISMILGLAGLIPGSVAYPPIPGLRNFHASISSELLAIGITVLIIDDANERLAIRQQKDRLITQLGSPNRDFALEALRQIRLRRWHADGTLRKTDLHQANLAGADLSGSDLRGAWLLAATLAEANLAGANLGDTIMTGAILTETDFTDACLRGALLTNADLTSASFDDTDASQAILNGANLSHAFIGDSSLRGASLREATLVNANLRGTDFTGADITDEQLLQSLMLLGATMQDGSRYNGKFNCLYDLNYARRLGISQGDREAMAEYYGVSSEEYSEGQVRSEEDSSQEA